MIDRLDTYDLNDKNTPYMVAKMASTINELVDEVNRQGKAIKNMPFAKVGDEVLIATDDGHKFFKVVMPETPPEKETDYNARTSSKEEVEAEAIAAYKKRIIKELEEHKRTASSTDELYAMAMKHTFDKAILVVRSTQ